MTRLYLIRHGETEWNKQNRTQGCGNDLSLSEFGIMQAKAVAKRFIDEDISAIFSSDLKRAYETAEEISKIVLKPIITSPGLREMNFGCFEGLTSYEISTHYKDIYERWRNNPMEHDIPQAESFIMLKNRTLDTVSQIITDYKGKNIIIISHGITIKIMIMSLLGMDPSLHSRLRINNTGVSILDWREHGPVLTLFNDVCHLHKEML